MGGWCGWEGECGGCRVLLFMVFYVCIMMYLVFHLS